MNGLRHAVRECPHGIDRRPTGMVVRLGPLVTEADAEAVGAWPRAGKPDDGTLPDRLRAAPAPQRVADLN
jgi:hypothetical protein